MQMRALPDVTSDVNAETPSALQWVGMEQIAVPISVQLANGKLLQIPAKANVLFNVFGGQPSETIADSTIVADNLVKYCCLNDVWRTT